MPLSVSTTSINYMDVSYCMRESGIKQVSQYHREFSDHRHSITAKHRKGIEVYEVTITLGVK